MGPLGFEFPKSVSRDSLIYLSPIDVTIARVMSWQQIDLIIRESAGTFTRVRTNELALKKWADQQLGEVQIKVSQRLSALKIPRIGPKGVPIEVPHVMAVLNVTPDSFSDGGNYSTPDQAISAGIKMASYGADIIDVGGDSTRPKSMQPSAIIEEERVLPVVRGLVKAGLTVSIDTRRPEVMVKGASEGAAILNDVSSLYGSEKSIKVVSSLGLPIILTHMQGIPENMQDNPTYNAAPFDIFDWLETRILDCQKSGIMSKKVNASIIGVIENMSYMEVDKNKLYPFGKDGGKNLASKLDVPILGSLPLLEDITISSEGSDLFAFKNNPQFKNIIEIAKEILKFQPKKKPIDLKIN